MMDTDKENKQENSWLSIINLIVSFISVIGIVSVGVYTVKADNDTQVKLVQLQHESNFAFIETTTSCSLTLSNGNCSEILVIKNTGQATAKSVKVDIAGENQNGLPPIDDVRHFVIHHEITPIDIRIKPIKQSSLIGDTQNNFTNEYEVDIPNLPPNSAVQLQITPSSSLFKTYAIDNKQITVHLNAKNLSGFSFASTFPVASVIRKFFEENYFVKKFQIISTCDNCEGQNLSGQPDNLSSNSTNVQGSNDVNSITVSGLTMVNLQELTAQSPDNSTWMGTVSVTYLRPKAWVDAQQLPTPLVLYAEMNDPSTAVSSSGIYEDVVTLCQGGQCQ